MHSICILSDIGSMLPLWFLFNLVLVGVDSREMDQLPKAPDPHKRIWHQILWEATNNTGQVSRDPLLEVTIRRVFEDFVKPKVVAGEAILGTHLDPVWLFPIGPLNLKKKKVFRGEMTACNLHMHNMKSLKIKELEVQRDENLNMQALRIILESPIVWMTGVYSLKRALLFGFLPAGGTGSFNIDLKDITVGLIVTLRNDEANNGETILDRFEVGFHWRDTTVKFDSPWRGFDKVADILLNKLEVGHIIVKKQRTKIIQELEDYSRGLFECILFRIYDGPEKCMRDWWIERGWTFPWVYPTCNT